MPGSKERNRLYNEGAMAANRGDFRACFDKYRKAYEAVRQDGKSYVALDYLCISGLTSLIRYEQLRPTEADLEWLKKIGAEESKSSPQVKALASFTLGFARRNLGDREGAARAYRRAIEAGRAATGADRKRTETMPDMRRPGSVTQQPSGPLIDEWVMEAQINLSVLEGRPTNAAGAGSSKMHLVTAAVGPNATAEDMQALQDMMDNLTVAGSACDACGKARLGAGSGDGAGVKLLTCAGCQAAYYCSPECQKAAWKSHKPFCGPLKPGLKVMLKGLESRPELNGRIVELVGPAQPAAGAAAPPDATCATGAGPYTAGTERWFVAVIGAPGNPQISIAAKSLQRIRLKRAAAAT